MHRHLNVKLIIMSSKCFEHPSVRPVEDLYMQSYGISFMDSYNITHNSSYHRPDCLYGCIKNTIEPNVQVFLRMNTWMFERCRRRYDWIKPLMRKVCILLVLQISSWIWSIISGVVTVLGRPGRRATQVAKSPRLSRATQFLTVAYDGACFPNVSIRMAWISFGALPCRKKKTWLQLASGCCWNRARRLTCFLSASVTRKDLQFGTLTYPSFQRHYRLVLRHREVGWAKDLSVPPRM